MPSYDKAFLNCEKTIDRYSKEREKATGWNRYMLGRRESDFVYTLTLQHMNIHTSRLDASGGRGGYSVCSCGLKSYSHEEIHLVGGHLYDGKPISQLVVNLGGELGHVLYCQKCEENFPIVDDGPFQFYGIPDVDAKSTLAVHENCSGTKKPLKASTWTLDPKEAAQEEYAKRGGPIQLPLINQEPDEVAFRESFRTKKEE